MFPQLGAPVGFFLSGSVFLVLSRSLTNAEFFEYGWRLPFLASAVLVFLGLYVRLTITETPVFAKAMERGEQVRLPLITVFRDHKRELIAGTVLCLATFILFYLMIVFALSWGTTRARLQPRKVPAHAALRHALLRADDSPLRHARRTRTPPRHALDYRGDLPLRLHPRATVRRPAPSARSA